MEIIIKNKRGDYTGLLFLIVNIAAFAIFLLIIGYIAPQISDNLATQIGTTTTVNNSLNVVRSISENTLPTIWLMMFGGLILGLFATSYFIKTHPIFVPIFGLLLIVAIMVAVPLSNAYEALAENVILDDAAAHQVLIVFIMVNLPLITLILGLITLVITFAKKDDGGATLA